eukprot:scaffold1183_cov418-Prasinococcus_capsulatus_cf.AAC.41
MVATGKRLAGGCRACALSAQARTRGERRRQAIERCSPPAGAPLPSRWGFEASASTAAASSELSAGIAWAEQRQGGRVRS